MKYHILIEFEADALPPDFTDQIAGRVYGMACVKKGEVIATITPPPVPNIGWQPIEIAPKSEKVLLWATKHNPHAFIGCWDEYDVHNQPRITHWMPLPKEPQ